MSKTCTYKKVKSDSYNDYWKTECGRTVAVAAPIEVGMCFPPKPNEDGKFCPYCGGFIELKGTK